MDVIVKPLEKTELVKAARVFLHAFNLDSAHIETMAEFWHKLCTRHVGEFVVATQHETVLGCGALFPYRTLAWIGYMAVDPFFQRQGIGSMLVEELLSRSEEKGIPVITLNATTEGKPLYTKYGFHEVCAVVNYDLSHCSFTYNRSLTVSQTLPLWAEEMDRESVGGDRRALLCLLLNMGGKVILLEEEGYGILWGERIGPIVAKKESTAREILAYASTHGAKTVYIPHHTESIVPCTATELSRCTQMIYGEPREPQGVYASFGYATG